MPICLDFVITLKPWESNEQGYVTFVNKNLSIQWEKMDSWGCQTHSHRLSKVNAIILSKRVYCYCCSWTIIHEEQESLAME